MGKLLSTTCQWNTKKYFFYVSAINYPPQVTLLISFKSDSFNAIENEMTWQYADYVIMLLLLLLL